MAYYSDKKGNNHPNSKRYTDEEKNAFCELAQSVGIGRAIRELKYPTYTAGMMWMEQRGIEPAHNELMEKARKYHKFYKTEDMLKTVDEALSVIESMYAEVETPDDAKKLAEAVQKLMNTRLLLEGKANSISEKRETTQQDLEIAELLRSEEAKVNSNSPVERTIPTE